MPQIEEYNPQVAAPEGIGGVSPNTEFAGAFGRGLEKFGSDVAEGFAGLHRKNVNQESAEAYSFIADQRQQLSQNIQSGIQKGDLDVNKFTEDFDNQMDTYAQNLDTSEGRNFFERQRARLKGGLLTQASHGMAQIASNQAQGNFQSGVDKSSDHLMDNPADFHDVVDQGQELVNSLVENGGLPEKYKSKALAEMGQKFAMAAIRGQADLNPDVARHMIKEGGFDDYLTGNQKREALQEVDRRASANEVEQNRTKKAVEDEQKAVSEKWGADNLEKLNNNALSTKEVISAVQNGTLKWEQGERWINMIKEGANQEVKTDPRVKNALIQRIVNPESHSPITDQADLMPYVGKGISVQDFNSLNSLFHKTAEQQAAAQGEKALFDSAKKTIRFKNMQTQQYDVLGEQKLAQFMSDYIDAKKQVKAQGGTASDLGNPNSPLYFGQRLDSYTTSQEDQLNYLAQDRTNKALGLKDNNPNQTAAPVKDARKPNESQAQYLKRMGL